MIHHPEEWKLKADQPKYNNQPNKQRPNTKPLASALETILSKINSEENEWGSTVSDGHYLRLGVFTLTLIIASAHLLPVLLTADNLNIIIMIMGETITMMFVSEGASKTCKKYKLHKRGIRSSMPIYELIKSRIKFDTDLRLNFKRHRPHQSHKINCTRRCRR